MAKKIQVSTSTPRSFLSAQSALMLNRSYVNSAFEEGNELERNRERECFFSSADGGGFVGGVATT